MPAQPAASDRLDSWKAIAEYLGRDVATVRRWEKSQGLPIRRVPGGQGRSVFAFRVEIDAWLTSAAHVSASPPVLPPPPQHAGITDAAAPWRPGPRAVLATLASLFVLSAAGLLVLSGEPHDADSPPVVELTPAAVILRNGDGVERWRRTFDDGAMAIYAPGRPEGAVTQMAAGDGFIVSMSYSETRQSDSAQSGQLLWLAPDGQTKRRFQWRASLPFAGETFTDPWAMSDYRLHPALGADRIAVAAHHFKWWPSIVSVLDARWERRQTFVNAGWIERVLWLTPDRLLIAGYSNARQGGVLAILNTEAMTGQSPPAGSRYHCNDCGPSSAVRYIVLPRSELNRVLAEPFNRATTQVASGRIIASTLEVQSEHGHAPEALYEFSFDLDLLSAAYGDRYWEKHLALEASGRLDHPRERCPERFGPLSIEVWDAGSGWRTIPTPRPSSVPTR